MGDNMKDVGIDELMAKIQVRGKRPVARRLFNDVDYNNEDFEAIALHALQEYHEMKKIKWNFDFNTGRPLPGPWVWTLPDEEEPARAFINLMELPQEEDFDHSKSI